MISFEQLESIVDEHIGLIAVDANSLSRGKDLAAKFLVITALLANHLKSLEDAKAQLVTLTNANFAQAMFTATGKNVTENKINAEANPEYAQVRESSEKVDSEVNWTKNHMKIFENAHILFRQYTRDQ